MGGSCGGEVRFVVRGSESQASKASLRAGVVHRDPGPWSATVLAFLRHLEQAGFAGAPRVVGSGFAPDGREMVTYIDGASPQPNAWAEDAVGEVGRLLRDLHTAAATFVPAPDAVWRPWFGRQLPGSRPVFGHCDTGPWNIIARGGCPVALIDFEFAGPVDALWELAQAAWLNAQLHDDDSLPIAHDRVPARPRVSLRIPVRRLALQHLHQHGMFPNVGDIPEKCRLAMAACFQVVR
jgi:hypothetical protein